MNDDIYAPAFEHLQGDERVQRFEQRAGRFEAEVLRAHPIRGERFLYRGDERLPPASDGAGEELIEINQVSLIEMRINRCVHGVHFPR